MLNRLFLLVLLCCSMVASAQYKNDNVLYQTVDPADLCPELARNKGYILLDVRSKGENSDTSTSLALNIGRLKGATNIDIRELGTRLNEIREFRDQPVFVYCSHSQRSRRASKMLIDSGFSKVYNVNGGLTALYNFAGEEKNCLSSLIESNNKFRILSPVEFCAKISGNKNAFLLDVRPDSAFKHIARDAKTNAQGYFRGSVNIPVSELESRLSMIPAGKEIYITDLYGGDAAKAATFLTQRGYSNVYILIEGVSRWLATDENDLSCKENVFVPASKYRILNSKEFGRLTQSGKDYYLLDIRTADEFGNKSKDSWRNIGHLKNAVNIPEVELKDRLSELDKFRNKEIIVYGFSGAPEAYAAAQLLHEKGFKKVSVLASGLFNVRWLAANDKSQSYLREQVTDVPEINW